ncbi:MAG: hypothetical protein ACCK39_01155 [Candidatus Karelsulcia muelleri]
MLTNEIKPGISTLYLENTICASINEQIIHGEREIVSIDCGVKMKNYYGEHSSTFEVGNVN